MNWKKRREIEEKIVYRLLAHIIEAGHEVAIDNGEGELEPTSDLIEAYEQALQCDEEYVMVYGPGQKVRSILLVYGNDGWDLIADYSLSLAELLAPVEEFARTFDEGAV